MESDELSNLVCSSLCSVPLVLATVAAVDSTFSLPSEGACAAAFLPIAALFLDMALGGLAPVLALGIAGFFAPVGAAGLAGAINDIS